MSMNPEKLQRLADRDRRSGHDHVNADGELRACYDDHRGHKFHHVHIGHWDPVNSGHHPHKGSAMHRGEGEEGIIYYGNNGELKGTTSLADQAIDYWSHARARHIDPDDILRDMVQSFTRSTFPWAYYCDKPECLASSHEDEPKSTEPTPVNNPEDNWGDFGTDTDGPKQHPEWQDTKTR